MTCLGEGTPNKDQALLCLARLDIQMDHDAGEFLDHCSPMEFPSPVCLVLSQKKWGAFISGKKGQKTCEASPDVTIYHGKQL